MISRQIKALKNSYQFGAVSVDPFKGLEKFIKTYTPLKEIPQQLQSISYEKDMLPALEIYKDLGFNSELLSRLWKQNPLSLTLKNNEDQNDIKKMTQFVKIQIGMNDKQIRSMLFKNPNIINLKTSDLYDYFQILKDELQITNEGLQRLLFFYPIIFDYQLQDKVKSTKTTLMDYAGFTPEEVGKVCTSYPYFLDISKTKLIGNFKVIHHQKFSSSQIKQLIVESGEFMTLNPNYFQKTLDHYISLVLDRKILREIIVNNSRLLLQCPHMMIQPKIAIFQEQGFNNQQIGQILQAYPSIFLKSTGSMKNKIQYLKKQFNVDFQKELFFPQILTYKYWEEIRPRGESLKLKDKQEIQWKHVLQLSNEQFISEFEIDPKAFEILIKEKPHKFDEIDYKKKKFTKYFQNSGRYIGA